MHDCSWIYQVLLKRLRIMNYYNGVKNSINYTPSNLRWCLDMLVLLRLKKKQYHICLANHEPQVICMWVPGKTTVQMQKVKSNYTLLFMRFSSFSSLIILQLLSRTTLTVLCPSFFNFPTVTKKNPANWWWKVVVDQ